MGCLGSSSVGYGNRKRRLNWWCLCDCVWVKNEGLPKCVYPLEVKMVAWEQKDNVIQCLNILGRFNNSFTSIWEPLRLHDASFKQMGGFFSLHIDQQYINKCYNHRLLAFGSELVLFESIVITSFIEVRAAYFYQYSTHLYLYDGSLRLRLTAATDTEMTAN